MSTPAVVPVEEGAPIDATKDQTVGAGSEPRTDADSEQAAALKDDKTNDSDDDGKGELLYLCVNSTYWPTIFRQLKEARNSDSSPPQGPRITGVRMDCCVCQETHLFIPALVPRPPCGCKSEDSVVFVGCKHVIGVDCALGWREQSKAMNPPRRLQCPVCRTPVHDWMLTRAWDAQELRNRFPKEMRNFEAIPVNTDDGVEAVEQALAACESGRGANEAA